jgi:hypothetical protein
MTQASNDETSEHQSEKCRRPQGKIIIPVISIFNTFAPPIPGPRMLSSMPLCCGKEPGLGQDDRGRD